MSISRDILFLGLTLLAEVIGTIGGFGSSVFFVPIANFFMDFQSVLGLTALFHLSSNLSKISLFREGIDKRLIIFLGIPAVIFVIIGGFLSRILDSTILEYTLSFFLIAISVLLLLKPDFKFKTRKTETISGGVLSGLAAGLLGTGGAIRGLTMAAFQLEKSAFIATSAAIDMGVDSSRTVVYLYNGYIGKELLVYIPFLLVIGFIGTYIGKKILEKIPQDSFRKLSLGLIFIIGAISLISLFWH